MKFYYDVNKGKKCEAGENRTRDLLIANHPSSPLGQSVLINVKVVWWNELFFSN
jgi:hypothetical protein